MWKIWRLQSVACVTLLVLLSGCMSSGGEVFASSPTRSGHLGVDDQGKAISHYLTSIIQERTGNYREALRELRRAADLAPDAEELQIRLISAYFFMQRYGDAVRIAERAVEYNPDSAALHIWLGRIYYRTERVDEATEAFQKAISMDPDSIVGYQALAEIEEDSNDLIGAIELYEKLVEITPESSTLHYRLGAALYELGDRDGALASITRALELRPGLSTAKYVLGVTYLELEQYPEAVVTLSDFLKAEPGHARAHVNLAGALSHLGEFDKALDVLNRLIESAEVEAEHHIHRMYLLLRIDAEPDASLAIAPSSAPLFGSLMRALVRKRVGEPYAEILHGLDTMEGDLDRESSLYLGDLLVVFGNEGAGDYLVSQLQELASETTESRVIETVLARTLMSLERYEEAESALLGVLNEYGSEKWVHYYLATVYEELDQHRDTEKNLQACLRIDPNDPDIMNFLGYMYAEENMKLKQAEKLLQRALQMDPENGFYMDSLGWVYYQRGDGERAVDYIERAIRAMSRDDAVLRDHLGDAYLLSGDKEQAVKEWRRALRLDPTVEGVQEKIDAATR